MANRSQRADAQQNRQRIIDAARDLYARTGQAPFNAVAAQAGVGNATMYRHFRTHDELREAVFVTRVNDIVTLLETLSRENNPAGELRQLLSWVAQTADMAKMGLETAASDTPAVRAALHTVEQRLDALLMRAQEASVVRDDVDRSALLVIASTLVSLGRNPRVPADRISEFISTVMRGLAP